MYFLLSKLPFSDRLIVPKDKGKISSVNDLLKIMGLTTQLMSGFVSLTSLTQIMRLQIERRTEMLATTHGFLPTGLPFMFPADLLKNSGKFEMHESEFYKFQIGATEMLFSPTTEEPLLAQLSSGIYSYKQLPLRFFHPHHVFRHIKRPAGLFKSRDFAPILLSSLDIDRSGFRRSVANFTNIARSLFFELGIEFIQVNGKHGEIVEFLFHCDVGDRTLEKGVVGNRGHEPNATEGDIDHTVRYGNIAMGYEFDGVDAFDVRVQNSEGLQVVPVMGTFGIGTQRCIYAMFQRAWQGARNAFPKSVRPIDVLLVPLDSACEDIVSSLDAVATTLVGDGGYRVAVDDRRMSVAAKLHLADFLSVPIRVLLGARDFAMGTREIRHWSNRIEVPAEALPQRLLQIAGSE